MGKNESEYTKKAKAEIKENKKKEKDMKKLNLKTVKTVVKYLITVVVTLGVVYAGYWLYQQGYNSGVENQKAISNEVKTKVDELAVTLKHNVK